MYFLYGAIFIIFLILDQVTKYFAKLMLEGNASIHIIGNFLRLTYVENRGAAFGMLQNQLVFFIIITIVLVSFLLYLFFNKKITKFSKYALALMLSGAIGNFIDRIRLGYVIDFIDVRFGNFYDFPVFNIADCCLVVGTIFIIILLFFNKFEVSKDDGAN